MSLGIQTLECYINQNGKEINLFFIVQIRNLSLCKNSVSLPRFFCDSSFTSNDVLKQI